jgi:hypothetical protein
MKKGSRFWFFYVLPWLAFAASYVALFIQQGSSVSSAISDALSNAVSAALLGILSFGCAAVYRGPFIDGPGSFHCTSCWLCSTLRSG